MKLAQSVTHAFVLSVLGAENCVGLRSATICEIPPIAWKHNNASSCAKTTVNKIRRNRSGLIAPQNNDPCVTEE